MSTNGNMSGNIKWNDDDDDDEWQPKWKKIQECETKSENTDATLFCVIGCECVKWINHQHSVAKTIKRTGELTQDLALFFFCFYVDLFCFFAVISTVVTFA